MKEVTPKKYGQTESIKMERVPVKKIGVVGLGLGYSLAHYLAYKDYDVVGVDLERRWEEPRLDRGMRAFIERHRGEYKEPRFTQSYTALNDRELILIFVSTPYREDTGRLSMTNVLEALRSAVSANPSATYLILSTLPIGGWADIILEFPLKFNIYYTPPMIKATDFLGTFKNPPGGIQMLGISKDTVAGYKGREVLYFFRSIQDRTVVYHLTTSDKVERAKLLINLMLSSRIIMANSIYSWLYRDNHFTKSEANEIIEMIGSDKRLGNAYFKSGDKAGGPCFPRDLLELEAATNKDYPDLGAIIRILNHVNHTKELIT